jgi:argonaute-like protein implicated in RNA metabolism and viral defense
MKKAYESLKNQEEYTAVDNHVMKALKLTGRDDRSAFSSILGKRLLTKSKIAPGKSEEVYEERKDELIRTIGEEAYERLELHDKLLEEYANFWKD